MTAHVFQVVTNTHTKSIQKQIKSNYAEEYATCTISRLLISRSNLQASETGRRCTSVLVYTNLQQASRKRGGKLISIHLPAENDKGVQIFDKLDRQRYAISTITRSGLWLKHAANWPAISSTDECGVVMDLTWTWSPPWPCFWCCWDLELETDAVDFGEALDDESASPR